MNDMDKDFSELGERLRNYEASPDKQMWENISSKLPKAKPNYLVVSVVASAVVLAGFVAMLVLAPEKSEKPLVKNEKAVEKNQEQTVEEKTAFAQNQTAFQPSETAKENFLSAVLPDKTMTQERQRLDQSDLKSETKEQNAAPKTSTVTLPQANNKTKVQSLAIAKTSEPVMEAKAEIETPKGSSVEPIRDTVYTRLLVPNAFTPLGDEKNRIFKPRKDEVKSYRMDIYNRQGLVFTSNDIEIGWDGTFEGQLCNGGVYYYIIRFTDTKDIVRTQKGSLMLLR